MFRFQSDIALLWILRIAAAIAGAIVVLIGVFLAIESLPALHSVGVVRFFTDASWHPAAHFTTGLFNTVPMLVGTLYVTIGALLIATPIGLASAIFTRFYAPPPVGAVFRRLIELLAGIPSVVYGLWGLVVLTPIIRQWQPPGQSLLAGIVILALMILPTVALLTESSLQAVPVEYLRGGTALGLSRRAVVFGVAIPTARNGLVSAILLAAGRAIGETMAVLMVAGNVVQVPDSLFAPIRTLTANIALEMGYAMDYHRSALFVGGLMLMIAVLFILILSDLVSVERTHA